MRQGQLEGLRSERNFPMWAGRLIRFENIPHTTKRKEVLFSIDYRRLVRNISGNPTEKAVLVEAMLDQGDTTPRSLLAYSFPGIVSLAI